MPKKIILPTEIRARERALAASPVTKVYVKDAIIYYERQGAEPVVLGDDPKSSRKEALQRAKALGEMSRDTPLRYRAISETGKGITYQELIEQTQQAVLASREQEAKLIQSVLSKRRRHRR